MNDAKYAVDRRKRIHRIAALVAYFSVLFAAFQWGGTELLRRCWYLFIIPTGMICFADSVGLETGHSGPSKGWNFFPKNSAGTIRHVGWFILVGVPAAVWLIQSTGS